MDDWEDKCLAVMTCNKWTLEGLLAAMPACLTSGAKRAFDSLTDEDKETKEAFFKSMRTKIDPQSAKKNKESFIMARRGSAESVTSFVDRLRMYIRRAGMDPNETFALEMSKIKIFESLNATDRKILSATLCQEDDIEKIILTTDSMLVTHGNVIGAVTNQEMGRHR